MNYEYPLIGGSTSTATKEVAKGLGLGDQVMVLTSWMSGQENESGKDSVFVY